MIQSSNIIWASVFFYAIFCVFSGNYDTSTWLQPYNLIVPFKTTTYLGWFMLYLIQVYLGTVYSLSKSSVTTYFMCCCYYVEALCQHFEYKVHTIKTYFSQQHHSKMNIEKSRLSRRELEAKMKDLIKHHIMTTE